MLDEPLCGQHEQGCDTLEEASEQQQRITVTRWQIIYPSAVARLRTPVAEYPNSAARSRLRRPPSTL